MPNDQSPFAQLKLISQDQGASAAIEFLISHFRDNGEYPQLFEALKLKVRSELGLPVLYSDQQEPIDDAVQRELEKGLLDACRDVGESLVKAGELQQGWMYLQPIGDRNFIRQLIESIEVTEENREDLIQIALFQAASPELGYRLLLECQGTCNAITTFDNHIVQFEKPMQGKLATLLIDQIYSELVANVRGHIEKEEPASAKEIEDLSLDELTSKREWLTADGGHHVDTTHLASVMRIGRVVDEPGTLQKLCELARYGQRLHQDFKYKGTAPFEDTYEDHLLFYQALTGNEVAKAIKHFDAKIKTTDRDLHGTVAIETLIDLLARTGNRPRAIDVATEQLLGQQDAVGIAPNLLEIAQEENELRHLLDHYQSEDDLLGYSIALLKIKSNR